MHKLIETNNVFLNSSSESLELMIKIVELVQSIKKLVVRRVNILPFLLQMEYTINVKFFTCV